MERSRLYPAYWISGILTFLVILIWGLPGRETSIHDAFMNILMFHEYIGISHIDGVYWTLTIELTFYCWIFAFFVTGLLQYAEYLFSPIIILSILQSQGIIELPSILNKIFIIHYLSYFLAGICFYKLVNGVENKLTSAILILSLISIFFVFSLKVFILSAIFYTFFFLAVTGKLKFLTIKPLLFLGGISYSLYLIHQNIGYVIINHLYDYNINPLISIAVSLLITIVLAYFITYFVEKPSLVAIRNIYRKFT
ncbi:acyltransferase family protein [Thalassotalea piscium]|uniref:acyltransferase family protein n=1 Tax=Thalassotalea piscium TaxID=1230533 RepID=UPI0036160111